MTREEKYKITSNEYTDLFVEYNRNLKFLDRFPGSTTHIINTRYAIAYVPASLLTEDFITQYSYSSLPNCYGLMSEKSLEASDVQRLRRLPAYNLRGQGVFVAVIDTGIDYTNPIFRRTDGTSKIVALWDQTISSDDQYPEGTFFGTEYNNEQINQALSNQNPLEVVPSTDNIGHGTMLAGIAAGNEVPENEFSGVAPDSDLIIVKLKQAKTALREFLQIPLDANCYQENDILWALDYVLKVARKFRRPVAICIGLGTSQGSLDGKGPLNNMLSFFGDYPGVAITVPAGNEGNKRGHFFGAIPKTARISTVELNIGENESGFTMELWGTSPNTYSIDILSPTGEYIPQIVESLYTHRKIRFLFEDTTIFVDYEIVGTHRGEQLILIRFIAPSPGIWKINVYSRGGFTGTFHIWLPISGFISDTTFFIRSDPTTTITSPADASSPIAVTAYNPESEVLFLEASKGFTSNNVIKPELAAPGVDVIVPTLEQGFTTASGTSIAAAHTTGISAMFLEWGIVKGNHKGIDSIKIKKYLIRGAKRSSQLQYPNREWGYGIIDVYNVFDIIRIGIPRR
ncbi:MAG: hypothetical protein K0R92_1918 [Lachnospiraceae bacterium]|jgi:subtilisin family serine protease|nr:hypothetical protein [Lachnospiraceae bacterium]